MPVTKRLLTELGVTPARADEYLPELRRALPLHGIDTDLRVAHFLGQVLQESGGLKAVRENMRYSAERLRKVFKTRFTEAQAREYAGKAERIGNRVYANRLGNGDEASGDGFRYRGRGLIQLTGKSHYRKFSKYIGEDVVEKPELVATKHAVTSALYFWNARKLNELADADDVSGITLKVNGRAMRGLAKRSARVEKAKQLLGIGDPVNPQESPTHVVAASRLNLRSKPKVSASTRMATLPEGTEVTKLGPGGARDWWRVRATVGGRVMTGVVSRRHLKALPSSRATAAATAAAPAPLPAVPEVHLPRKSRAKRTVDGARPFPLSERGMPRRRASDKVQGLLDIIAYLDSPSPAHLRYRPKPGTTFCNIYAYDYCTRAGAYLPRVWWRDQSLRVIEATGAAPEPRYGNTVRELNANMLLEWFEDYGEAFGWRRETCLDVLQSEANRGGVCVIVAQHRDANRSGHIAAVAPENGAHAAKRSAAGRVLRPLESQAGTKNHRFVTKSSAWWAAERYQDFGFFCHD
jgi:predicted chitinase